MRWSSDIEGWRIQGWLYPNPTQGSRWKMLGLWAKRHWIGTGRTQPRKFHPRSWYLKRNRPARMCKRKKAKGLWSSSRMDPRFHIGSSWSHRVISKAFWRVSTQVRVEARFSVRKWKESWGRPSKNCKYLKCSRLLRRKATQWVRLITSLDSRTRYFQTLSIILAYYWRIRSS